ncbi:MAG: site-specific DNA-methyltransferase [Prevotellaceae bacterium]|jgi:DNA modification methylase|nr:site-specific DNA-methyltransferase [Prevotellaceae bacterium]
MMEINCVYRTDCLHGLKNIDDESVDLIFTDPPYYQNRAQNIKNLKNHTDIVTEFKFDGYSSEEEYLLFIENVLRQCYRVSKNGASGYLWCGDDFVSYINRIVEKAGFKFRKVIHWHKTNPFPAIHTRKIFANSMELIVHFSKGTPKTWNHKRVNEMHNFIESPICMGKERKKHQTQKPLKVCIPFIEISSNANDLILDPFMGSGTTAVAALMTGRNFTGFEIDPAYCAIIAERFDEFLLKNNNLKSKKPEIKEM